MVTKGYAILQQFDKTGHIRLVIYKIKKKEEEPPK